MTQLSERGVVWSARAVWAVAAVLVIANAVLIVVAFPDLHPGDRFYNSLADVGGLLFASIGLLIVVRARNVIGWILMGTGVIIELLAFGEVYPAVGLRTHPGSLPAPDVVSAILQSMFPLLIVSIAVMLLVYPVGAPPSPRWRPVVWVAVAGAAMSSLGLAVIKESLTPIDGLSFPNPFAIRSFHGAISTSRRGGLGNGPRGGRIPPSKEAAISRGPSRRAVTLRRTSSGCWRRAVSAGHERGRPTGRPLSSGTTGTTRP